MGQANHFEDEGYCIFNLKNPTPVLELRHKLLLELRDYTGIKDISLEKYHHFIGDDDQRHTDIQYYLTEKLRKEKWHLPIFGANVSHLIDLIGPDLDVEAEPYLRIVRPWKPQDNIGYHRDTIYGTSPYELSVFVPFVDLDSKAALRIEPGSHRKSDADIPFTKIDNPDPSITRGSIRHKLGFLYAPHILDETYPTHQLIPIPLRLGQVLTFSLAILHGTIVNESTTARWSCDVRVKNAFLSLGARSERFMPLFRGPVTKAAEMHLKANQDNSLPSEKSPDPSWLST